MEPEVPFGQRLRAHREHAGKTRAVLAGLVGRSEEWAKAVETGRLQMPRLPMLIRLAEVLGVTVAELTGDQTMTVTRAGDLGEHPAAAAIRDAVHRYRLGRPAEQPQPVAVLQTRLDDGWRLWHQSRTRRTDVGAL